MTYNPLIQNFLDDLAAGTATPGGGGAAALAGAMGAALVSMACNLTIGREKYIAVEAAMKETRGRSEALRATLTQLIDEDIQAVDALMATFRMPKQTDEEKTARRAAVQAGTKGATLTQLAIARACDQVIMLCQTAVASGNPNAAGDAGAGAALALAGLKTASLNALINLSSIDDEAFVTTRQAELNRHLANHHLADEIHETVKSRMRE